MKERVKNNGAIIEGVDKGGSSEQSDLQGDSAGRTGSVQKVQEPAGVQFRTVVQVCTCQHTGGLRSMEFGAAESGRDSGREHAGAAKSYMVTARIFGARI